MAVLLMVVDDHPTYFYGTGRDPGGAAVLSIILADFVALLALFGVRGSVCAAVLAVEVVPKLYFQIYLSGPSHPVVTLTLLLSCHAVLGWFACGPLIPVRFAGAAAGLAGTVLAFALASLFQLVEWHWIVVWWQLAFLRIVLPFLFWSAVLFVRRKCVSPRTPEPGFGDPIRDPVSTGDNLPEPEDGNPSAVDRL